MNSTPVPTTLVKAPKNTGCIPDFYRFRKPDGERITVDDDLGYSCCIDEVKFEIWEVNHFIGSTDIVFQYKSTN